MQPSLSSLVELVALPMGKRVKLRANGVQLFKGRITNCFVNPSNLLLITIGMKSALLLQR